MSTNTVAVCSTPMLTLEEELHYRGVPTLPKSCVARHKRRTLWRHWLGAGWWTFMWCFLCVRVLGASIFMMARESHNGGLIFNTGAGVFLISLIAFPGGLIMMSVGPLAIGLLLCFPFAWFLTGMAFIYFAFKINKEGAERVTSRWVRTYVHTQWDGIPPHLRDRIQKASIPKSTVKVEYFDEDPFIVVTRRRWGPLKETCYIGAWDTGVPELDNT